MNPLAHYTRPGSLHLPALPPLALYIHLPWCIRKCPYCDFNSHALPDEPDHAAPRVAPELQQRYIAALCADLESVLPLVWGRQIHSIFLGGGTPSLFDPASIDSLLSKLRSLLPFAADLEITLEANPGTYEKSRFADFAAAGITRLSVGVQSLNDAKLAALGRVHSAAQSRAALEEVTCHFKHWNADLMYALPGQSQSEFETDLQGLLSYQPPHLSVYHLTIEENTAFAKQPPAGLPDEDSAYAMLDAVVAQTAQAGLTRYEVSAFARPGHTCWHNLNYWNFGDYIGIGAGAHSKISFAHRIIRQQRMRHPAQYMQQALQGQAASQSQEVQRRDLPFEFMLGALRLVEGFELQNYVERTGMPMSSIAQEIEQGIAKGLLEMSTTTAPTPGTGAQDDRASAGVAWPSRLRPTARGMDFLSDAQSLFLPRQP